MAIGIRLTRHGKRGAPCYSIVVSDTRTRRDGRYIDKIGTYQPRNATQKVVVDKELAQYWLKQGPRLSQTVKSILHKEGLV